MILLQTADDWIRAGLEMMSQTGIASVKVEAVARQLRISKGSFYHYFKDRADFLEAILAYWEKHLTQDIIRQMDEDELSPKERLRQLVHHSFSETTRLQAAIVAWANQDELIAERMMRIEQERVDYLSKLFYEMGFSPVDSVVRAELCYFTFLGWIDRKSRNPALISVHLADEFINLISQQH
ncbi:TetR/AcrR family transcriptional regulator [Paenibacillus sp. SYP-B3998]|uniref:TetR/AcrR family transcriptional regulator n=1 Tax=Paenibacillus sp. SYP-B3998 TaxID=2678564 RepID=A0A6G3ZYY6_9BACL|nr:TetR/AcrR family transcriptional regulator [Paenibacillus sp. SYP-B3998]NEW07423.1 TetR/AcrR family transcriptional regulator [Paenibacillus sp. SYP-B3998]